MAEAAKDTDQSMEDILQSIKRIIADEETPAAPGSDVLELTELLAEDVAPPAAAPAATEAAAMSIDDIMAAPVVDELPVAAVPAPAAQAAPAPAPKPAAAVAAAVAPSTEKLASEATIAASAAALKSLAQPAPVEASMQPISQSAVLRSGATVEDLVVEALKPMLKEWLDANLPTMVKTLVEKEIRRLSA